MFFQPEISSKHQRILEIGPGGLPHRASSVWLDYDFDEAERERQAGGAAAASGKPCVYYHGQRFPFRDQAFDYIIASHVIEHVPWAELPAFIAEMQRVAPAGYIELPRWPYECMFDFAPHVSTGDVQAGKLVMYRKPEQLPDLAALRGILAAYPAMQHFLGAQKEVFFCGLEWRDSIAYELIEEYPANGSEQAVQERFAAELSRIQANPHQTAGPLARLAARIARRVLPDRLSRPGLSLPELRELMECPWTASSLDADWRNGAGQAVFAQRELELRMLARQS